MKKLNKLFAILIAVLGASTTAKAYTSSDLTASGWTEVTSLPKSNEELSKYYYVFYATEADLMLAEETHGTQENQLTGVYRTPADPSANKKMVWTLEYNESHFYGIRNLTNPLLLLQSRENAPWRVQAAWEKIQSEWTQWDFIYADGTWTIKNKLAKGADANDHIGPWDTKNFVDGSVVAGNKEGDDIGNFRIYAISRYTFDNINTDFDYESATAIAPLNITPLIVNAGFEYAAGWWNYTVKPGVLNNNSLEYWNGTASSLQFDINQSISKLPAGKYELKAELFNSYNGQAAGTNGGRAYLYASVYDGTTTTEYKTVVEPTTESTLTSHQTVLFVPSGIASENIKVTIGVKTIGTMDARWFAMDNFQLFYCGVDLTALMQNLQDKITEAETINSESLNTGIKGILTTAINNAKNVLETEEDIMAKSSALDQAMSLANSSIAPYADINSLITLCETYAAESYSTVKEESTRTTFTTAISTATTNKENATTAAKLTEAYNTLEAARQDFILVAIPTTGNSYDMTFKIENPSFETGDLTGWTVTASSDTGVKPNSNGTYTTTGVDGNYLFNTYWKGNPLTQEISGLPSGVYELKVLVASDGGTVYLTADDKHNEGTMTSDKTIFLESSIEFVCTDGNAVIGVVGGADGDAAAHKDFVADGYWWYKADNFRLYRSFDPSTAQNEVKELKSSATALLSKPMNKEAKATFESKINSVDENSDNPFELASMATMLNEAIAEAKVSITEYEKLKKYIDMTAVFTDVTNYTTKYNNGEYASTDVETTRQELNVMRFNAASDIYKNKVDVTGWTGSMGERSDQHWSGTAISYKDANSWYDLQDDALTTTVHLIKGSYVLKVAGRSATENARLTLEVLGNTIEFHAKGDTGYGIDTDGNANFSPEGTYANDGKGRGWEWEFLKFTLDEDQNVTLSVNSYYNNTWQVWNSFGDISLWMDDETYVTVYAEAALKAPLAEANAMVNTKPMGTAENEALVAAIELSNTFDKTPEGLNGAVDALTEAVANAKAWVTAYNEAKVPLVAALERFEADYNDAQNGVLSHLYMCKSLWTAAINMAKAAADAKDVLNSYDGFETAAENLNDALDAVTRSDGEYEALDAAIKTASSLYSGGNWGDQPFQRPTSAKENLNTTAAQATYDAAEADGEAVTSVTEALNNGLNGIVLNAPKEGTCYKIVMGDLTWTNNDNATMLSTKDKSLVFVKGGQSEVQGLYSINFIGKNNNYAHALIFNAVKNKINQYTISFIDNDGATRYICDGSVTGAGTGVYGIRTTTDAANALPVEVRATATEGVWNLYNTVAKELLGAQDAGFFTTARNNNLKIMEAPKNEVTLTFSSVGWATLILPFDAELPEGVLAYSCGDTDETEGTLTLEKAESLKANTPYLMNSYGKEFTFSGYGLATKDSYTDGLFTGTYENYKTTNDGKTYVLQNINGEVAFYLVGEKAQPTVKPNRIYMTYESTNGAAAPRFSFGRGEGTTSVDNMEPTANSQQPIVVYDLMGRKVTTMEKGGMYIVNGKKVIVK